MNEIIWNYQSPIRASSGFQVAIYRRSVEHTLVGSFDAVRHADGRAEALTGKSRRQAYSSIDIAAGYEHQESWRKDGYFMFGWKPRRRVTGVRRVAIGN